MVPPPDAKFAAEKIGSWPSGGNFRVQFFAQFSKRKFGKSVDERSQIFFACHLSSLRKLFEIYFVRLIGTPNQNSKMVFQLRLNIWQQRKLLPSIVVHESLGSELFSESLILAQNERWRRG